MKKERKKITHCNNPAERDNFLRKFISPGKNQKGLTLVEMIIAIAVLGLLLLVSVGLFAAYTKARAAIKQNEQAAEEASLIVDEISKKLRMSNCDFIDPADGDLFGYNDSWMLDDTSEDSLKECYLPRGSANYWSGCDFDNTNCAVKVILNSGQLIAYNFTNGFGGKYQLLEYFYGYENGTFKRYSEVLITDHVMGAFGVVINDYYSGDRVIGGIPFFQIKLLKMGNDNKPENGVLIETAVSQRGGYNYKYNYQPPT